MTRAEWDNDWKEKMAGLTVAEIEERFQNLFHREMTPEERFALFLPDQKTA